eukprot:TRINITY_DN29551_c0_g1_i1.p2 TRINITY_DN29551_c0_g1~~TRINITY_DN29551_c0_g1_i1.p2  ORF type:complete len:351 (+),score=81.47 TRINITY_DN29551_c0_g1_i1:85-1053(+)
MGDPPPEPGGWRATPSALGYAGGAPSQPGLQRRPLAAPGVPTFDPKDNAPEDFATVRHRKPADYAHPALDPRTPLVCGTLRLEGVSYARYESAKVIPERQKAFTTALRDDLISEAGCGVTRDDILLRLIPGPIRSLVLDYAHALEPGHNRPGPPRVSDAEWCIDVEYAIATRDAETQRQVARALFDALAGGDASVPATRDAYVHHLHPDCADPGRIACVPTASAEDRERAAAVAGTELLQSPAPPGLPAASAPQQAPRGPYRAAPAAQPPPPYYPAARTPPASGVGPLSGTPVQLSPVDDAAAYEPHWRPPAAVPSPRYRPA